MNAIFDDKTYNEDLKNAIWTYFCAVVDAEKEERLNVISTLKKLAIMKGDDEKAIEFLGFLEGKDTTNYDDVIRLILDNSITMYTLGEPQYLEYLKNINGIKKVEICDEHVKICLSNGKNIIFPLCPNI